MTYSLLGQDLQETADRAKKYFANDYGATHFICEKPVDADLQLRPTWQANLKDAYKLCLNVQPTPFTPTLHEFVNKCARRGLPIKLWVAVPSGATKETFKADLKQAREMGVGVVEIDEAGHAHEFHRPVPLSLFALTKSDPNTIPKAYRNHVKTAESTFLDGTPEQGCQAICQELEDLTRKCAEDTHGRGCWKAGGTVPKPTFFDKEAWAIVLETFEDNVDVASVKAKCPDFSKQYIVKARAHTDWRNIVSHKPKNLKELNKRDAKLRPMFEVTRDLLIEWATMAKPLKVF